MWTTLISNYSDTFTEKITRERVLRKPEDTLGFGHRGKQEFHVREVLVSGWHSRKLHVVSLMGTSFQHCDRNRRCRTLPPREKTNAGITCRDGRTRQVSPGGLSLGSWQPVPQGEQRNPCVVDNQVRSSFPETDGFFRNHGCSLEKCIRQSPGP